MTESERESLVERIREDLRKHALYLMHHSVRQVIDAYEARLVKQGLSR